MRIALALVLALAVGTGCAKKAKPAAAPASKATETTPGGDVPAEGAAQDDAVKGDPCDGGETKSK